MGVVITKSLERLAKTNPDAARRVLDLREAHKCLLKLPQEKILELQADAVIHSYYFCGGRLLIGVRTKEIKKPNGELDNITLSDYKTYNRI